MNFWFFNSHHKSKVLTVKAQCNVIGLCKFMVNGPFQIVQHQTNQLWLYLELNVILHDVLQLVSSSRGLSSTSWLQQCYHLKSSCPAAKNTETIFTPLHRLYRTSNDHPETAHMLPHITPLNVPTECVTFSFLTPATSVLLQSSLSVSYHCGTANFKQFHRNEI